MNKYGFTLVALCIAVFPYMLKAQFDVSPNSRYVGYSSGSTTYSVSSTVGWSVSDNASWLTAIKTSGNSIAVTYNSNTSTSSRVAQITAVGTGGVSETVTLTQAGFIPSLDVNPKDRIKGAEAGTATYTVTSNVGWSVSDDASWLTSSKTSGSSISVSFSANNTGADRIAYILAKGTVDAYRTVSLTQERAFISPSGPPTVISVAAGSQSVAIFTNFSEWDVSDNASWLTVSREGDQDMIKLIWDKNSSIYSRSANITVAGTGAITESTSFTITQEGVVPSLDVNPKDRIKGAEAGTATYTVTSNVGWSVSDDASWLTSSKTSGSSISVSFSANNTGADRIAYILAKGTVDAYRTVSLTQERAFISPSGPPTSISAAAGSQSVAIFTNFSEWDVSDNASWLTVSREGDQDMIKLIWDKNSSIYSRSANITVAGTGAITESTSFTITQEGVVPSLDVTPKDRIEGAGAGTATYTVTSNVGWSVSDDASWLTSSKTSGSSISVSFSANNTGADRIAYILAKGSGDAYQTVSLTQERAFISPSGPPTSISAAAGSQSVAIFTNFSEWDVSDNASWLTVSREGDQDMIKLIWDKNSSIYSRSANIAVAGTGAITESASFTITQKGAEPFIDVNPVELKVIHESGKAVFDVATNVGWSVSSGATWLSADKTSGSDFSVSYQANPTTTERYADIIATGTGGVSASVRIIQAGLPYLDIVPHSSSVGDSKGIEIIKVSSNVDWTVKENEAWVKTVRTGDNIEIRYDQNPVAVSRKAIIHITAGNIAKVFTLTQAALKIELDIGDKEEYVKAESGTLSHSIITNSSLWTVSTDASWLKATRVNDNLINVSFESNTSTISRLAFVDIDATGGVKGSFKVIQDGAEAFLLVDPGSQLVEAGGGTGTFSVQSNVEWQASENASWLNINKTDDGSIKYACEANPSITDRMAEIIVKGSGDLTDIVTVTQLGTEKAIEVDPWNSNVDMESGTLTFAVTANVEWSVSEDANWLTASKSDNNSFKVAYESNPLEEPRIAYISVGEEGGYSVAVSVTQAGKTITLAVSPKNQDVGPGSGSTQFEVSSNINWDVRTEASWITVGKNSSTILNVSYEANDGTTDRVAEIIVEGEGGSAETVTVTQKGEQAVLELSPDGESLTASAGQTTLQVISNLVWEVTTVEYWLTAEKLDESTILVNYEENTSSSKRSAEVIVSGKDGIMKKAILIQAGAILYLEVDPEGESVDSQAGEVIFKVQSNEEWAVSEDVSWLTSEILDDTSFRLSYEANAESLPRVAHIFVQGNSGTVKALTLTQASETITFDVSPNRQRVSASSGSTSFFVESNIEWGVSVDVPWISFNQADDSTLAVNFDANFDFDERDAHLIIFGTGGATEIVTLTQAAVQPYLLVDQLIWNVGAASDSAFISIRSNIGWLMNENSDWFNTVSSGDSLLKVYIDANTGIENRMDSIVLSGEGVLSQTILIEQEGSGATGIFNPIEAEQITIYPNPAHNQVYIRSDSNIDSGMLLLMFDTSGRMILKQNIEYIQSAYPVKIDLSGKFPGVYILQVHHSGIISSFKIIKK